MITKDHDEKYTENMNDHDEKYQVLSLIDQNKYATQIARITGLSVSKISRIIKWLKDMKYIRSTFGKPIFYDVITKGKLYMHQFLKKSKSKDSNDQDQDLIKIRIHKLRYFNELIYNPLHLIDIPYNRLIKVGKLTLKKIKMRNWDQFFIYFSYPRFRGLENIQITTQKVIYNFNRRKEDQIVYRPEEIDRYERDRINDCEQARLFLEANGFRTTGSIKELQKSKHYAVPSIGKGHIAEKGRLVETIINFPDGVQHIIDESDDAEEETNDKSTARSYLALPDKIDGLNKKLGIKINNLNAEVQKKIDNLNDDLKVKIEHLDKKNNGIELAFSKLIDHVDVRMTNVENGFKKLTDTITNMVNVLSTEIKQDQEQNQNTGGENLFI